MICDICDMRSMKQTFNNIEIIYTCSCGRVIKGEDDNLILSFSDPLLHDTVNKFKTIILNAAHCPTFKNVRKNCEKCGLDYRAQIILGDNCEVFECCKCGHILHLTKEIN